jgi:hypothetical protein
MDAQVSDVCAGAAAGEGMCAAGGWVPMLWVDTLMLCLFRSSYNRNGWLQEHYTQQQQQQQPGDVQQVGGSYGVFLPWFMATPF